MEFSKALKSSVFVKKKKKSFSPIPLVTRLPLLDDESKPSVQDVDIIGDIIDCKLFHESSSPGRRLGTRNGREALYLRSKLFFFENTISSIHRGYICRIAERPLWGSGRCGQCGTQ